jgi:hypothetical protein
LLRGLPASAPHSGEDGRNPPQLITVCSDSLAVPIVPPQASEAHQMTKQEAQHLQTQIDRLTIHAQASAKLLDRLLTCVPGPHSTGYKLAEIMKIAEEWQATR